MEPCSANGAQIRVGTPSLPVEKSRSRTDGSSNATRLRVLHCGSGTSASLPGPIAKFTYSLAAAEANSLADSAQRAGQSKAMEANCELPCLIA